jgi:pyrimidine operon attenuation protein/uracil phosphoribosyltransferase
MTIKTQLMDEVTMKRSLARITHEIIEHNDGVKDVVLLGIQTRGVPIAQVLKENIRKFEGVEVPVGQLDITLHRDDMNEEEKNARAHGSYIPCDVTGRTVILVDDVMFTGRTARAAMEAVIQLGRPKYIQLAVLVDRGHRELPIRPDYVGKNVPTSMEENVAVHILPVDEDNGVFITE